ncbi:MAG: MBL fold metallo-hydrolase [Thermodesulfobacteriota bacterium]|nr:MBL fold metallo-hydrolase [Thermodesulfobacteriota bacterium]
MARVALTESSMRPSFHPRLINDPFHDPGLFIPFLFEKRALLFDLGELNLLSSRDLLKVTHVFVTHTHMDHFIGFDTLLRIFLGREKELHIFGPPDFFKHVEGKLSGYTWNLVNEYQNNFYLKVTEVHGDKTLTRIYVCRDRFRPQEEQLNEPFSNIVLKEPSFFVEASLLDHRIPCMGLSLVENFYVNIIKEGLEESGLPVGAWLNRFKKALYEKRDLDSAFIVQWEERGKIVKEKSFVLGALAEKIARISPGQKITYLTDITGSPENYEKAVNLAKKADHLFVEAAFLDCDKEIARKKYHLTAKEAGELARRAGAKQFTPFHFSPRYSTCSEEIKKEAMEAFK